MQRQQKVPLKPLVTRKVVIVGGGQTKTLLKPGDSSVKELFYFVDQYHQSPEEPLLKSIVRATNLGAVSLVLNAAE